MSPRRAPAEERRRRSRQFRRRAAIAFLGVVLALAGLALLVLPPAGLAARRIRDALGSQPHQAAAGGAGARADLDRKGRMLADNVPAFRLDVVPDEAGDIEQLLAQLSKIVALSPEDIAALRARPQGDARLPAGHAEAARGRGGGRALRGRPLALPGVELRALPQPPLSHGELFAHVIGYVGRIDEADLAKTGRGRVRADATSARPAWSATTRTRCAARSATRRSRPTSKAARCAGSAACRRCRRRPAPDHRPRPAAGDGHRVRRQGRFGGRDRSAHRRNPGDGQPADATTPTCSSTASRTRDYTRADRQPVAAAVQPQRARRRSAGFDGEAADRPGRPGQRPAHARRTRCSPPAIPHPRPAPRLARRARRRAAGPTCASRSPQSVNSYYYKLAYDMGIDALRRVHAQYGFGQPTGIDLVGENQRHRAFARMEAQAHARRPGIPAKPSIAGIGQGYWKVTAAAAGARHAAIADGGDLRRLHLVAARRDGYDAPWTPLPQPRAAAHHRQPRAPARGAGRHDGDDAARRHRARRSRAARRT